MVSNEVMGLRESIAECVSSHWKGVPDRYVMEAVEGEPAKRITDTETGRSVEVGYCDMHGAIAALKAFG